MTRSKPDDEQSAAADTETVTAPTLAPETVPAAPGAPADADSRYEPYPGRAFFHGGRYSPINTAAGARLAREGHAPAGRRLGPDWTTAHRDAWKSYQQQLRPKGGGDTTGIPDQTAWDRLQVPRVTPAPKET